MRRLDARGVGQLARAHVGSVLRRHVWVGWHAPDSVGRRLASLGDGPRTEALRDPYKMKLLS
jgi:hypothetical protein